MVRTVTTTLMVGAVLLMVWIAALQGQRPSAAASKAVRRGYAIRLLTATTGVALCLVGAGVGAALYSRRAKEEYRRASLKNLRSLVEGESDDES